MEWIDSAVVLGIGCPVHIGNQRIGEIERIWWIKCKFPDPCSL